MENQDLSKDSGHGNFSLGLVVGVLAGATGYFLTKTDEGKELKKKVSKEWEAIRKKLEDEGVISGKDPDFADIVAGAREKIFGFLGEEMPTKKRGRGRPAAKNAKKGRPVASGKSSSKKKSVDIKTPAKRKKMFKGI